MVVAALSVERECVLVWIRTSSIVHLNRSIDLEETRFLLTEARYIA